MMLTIQLRQDPATLKFLERIAVAVEQLNGGLMALKDELTALITAFDTATTAVAAEIAKLKQQIADALNNPDSLTPEDKAAIEAGLQAQVDRLTALGQDPSNPVPPTT